MSPQETESDEESWSEKAAETSPSDLADQMRDQLKTWREEADDLGRRAREQGEAAAGSIEEGLDEIDQAIEGLEEEVDRLAEATGEEAEELKDRAAKRLDKLQQRFQDARDKVGQAIEA